MLLTDVFIIDNLKVLEESKAKGTMKISGIFQRADEANNNKRVYSKALLEREVVKLADMIDNRRLLGELDHPSHDSVKLSNVSHLVTNLKMQGSEVLGEAELLNTPAGLTAQALIKGGVGIGISSRGLGTLSEGEDGTKNVNEDFKLVTFDLVADPSTRGAYPTLSESTETKEIYDRTMKQAISEKVFVQSLKDRLNLLIEKHQPGKGNPGAAPIIVRKLRSGEKPYPLGRGDPDWAGRTPEATGARTKLAKRLAAAKESGKLSRFVRWKRNKARVAAAKRRGGKWQLAPEGNNVSTPRQAALDSGADYP